MKNTQKKKKKSFQLYKNLKGKIYFMSFLLVKPELRWPNPNMGM